MQLQQQHHMNGDQVNHMLSNSPMGMGARGHRSFGDGHHPMDLSSPQPQHYEHMNHRHYRNHSHEGMSEYIIIDFHLSQYMDIGQ